MKYPKIIPHADTTKVEARAHKRSQKQKVRKVLNEYYRR